MGILDDAIREHLDLKRKHGAPDDDVERLEKEAFGPPVRPGDPEFEGEDVTRVEETAADAAAAEDSDADGDVADPVAAAGQVQDWADALEENTEDHPDVAEPDSGEEALSAERGRIDYAELGDTVDHPAVPEEGEDEGELGEAEFGDFEPEAAEHPLPDAPRIDEEPAGPVEAPEAGIFDGSEEEDPGDDLDFDLEGFEEEGGERDVEAAPAEPVGTEQQEGFEADAAEEDELEDEDEDLLEETPDFLQDAPEGERLWFEQGEPKDFDFDDD